MKRRTLLKLLLLAPLAMAALYVPFRPSYRSLVAQAVRRRLSFLKLDPTGLEAFTGDFTTRYPKGAAKVAAIQFAAVCGGVLGTANPLGDRLAGFETFAAEQFLLGSDFFAWHQDESRVVAYLGFPDPYLRPCAHPFAEFE